ncbi:MAG: flagellar export chaperone FliS [Pirellulales bacterium]
METSARDNYLVTEVMTAAPQKLQLMLIDAAIRFGQRARLGWQNRQDEQAGEALIRCEQIMTELIAALRPEGAPEVVRKVGGVYLFVYRAFVEAHLRRDQEKLSEALSILEIERETWRQVCEQLGPKHAPVDVPAEAATSGMVFEA